MIYGKNQYGLLHYARDGDQDGGSEEYSVDLARYAPGYVAALVEMAEIYRVQGMEIGSVNHVLADLIAQCFVQTATWGLLRWEEVYGITTNLSLPYEQRREVILAKMRGQGTTTVEMIKNVASAFTGIEVEVIEDNSHYMFIIRFVGQYGVPRNLQAFREILEEIKPAHLGYELEYRFVIWDELRPYTWNDLRAYTWDGIRVNEIRKFVRWESIADRLWSGLEAYTWDKVKEIEEAKT